MSKFQLSLILCLVAVAISDEQGVNWALLVAGSNGYYNYRHQADVSHAYQIIHKNGIPKERIIVMMYDDIAFNRLNKNPGVLINRPNGTNVYEGIQKDYTGKHVTPEKFLRVLSGEKGKGLHKVIESGPNDNIFVYFSDHGAPGLVAFPDGSALHAKQLNKAIADMHKAKKYKNMVFYIEACESGSMFDKLLPNNINVYATTAANDEESSYACYFDEKLETFLGDLYSVSWMENSDSVNIFKESLIDQFKIAKEETNKSHVLEFGNITMGSTFHVSDFQSNRNMPTNHYQHDRIRIKAPLDAVRVEDVRMSVLSRRLAKEEDLIKKEEIKKEIEEATKMKNSARSLVRRVAKVTLANDLKQVIKVFKTKQSLSNHDCYMPVIDRFIQTCMNANNEYVLRYFYIFVNLCEMGISSEAIVSSIEKVCK